MNKKPVMDPRTKRELMATIRERAHEYAPEWRYDANENDPGAAIASLFGDMFDETIDRFNQVPEKSYTEFLNLLGVPYPTVTQASGFLQFTVSGENPEPVSVPAGTEVFAAVGEENIIFSTGRRIDVTAARLEAAYYADPEGGRIEKLDLSREQAFFAPAGNENLQRHRFAISQNDVLSLDGPCEIDLTLHQSARFLEESTAKRLADPGAASWKYFDGENYVAFDEVRARGSVLTLEKRGAGRLCADENGRISVYCDMLPGAEGSITLSGVGLSSRKPQPIEADAIANNDIPIAMGEGGYCFGRRPAPYELFYIRSDDVFRKRGALVSVGLTIAPVVVSSVGNEPQYEFTKRVIDKTDAVRVVPDDVFVQQVVWEYYNGMGWAKLAVTGNVNPFSCKTEGPLVVQFTVPDDAQENLVNAESGYHIRARVVNVENYYSQIPKWILPFVKEVNCAYQYRGSVSADYIAAHNNAKFVEIADAGRFNDLNITVFKPLDPHPKAMYFRFDAPPSAMPLSMLFEICGECVLSSKISFEALTGGRFEQVRSIDGTENLRYSGAVFLYLPDPFDEAEIFGETGYWLRMSLSSLRSAPERTPFVGGIRFNVVNALQSQRAQAQLFNTGPYDAGKRIELLEKPVIDCELWVDEKSGLTVADVAKLERDEPERVRVERENNAVVHCFVKWEPIDTLARALPDERVYELDRYSGAIAFGHGTNGRVPPQGDLNIRVEYSFGGGERGNLPQGAVNALVGSIPRIGSVVNITAMSGGTDRPAMAKIEALGNKRLRHRQRAVAAADFEEMTLERFQRAAHVKCFTNTDRMGRSAPGHVCLVVMGRELADERMTVELCREIYQYLAKRCDCNLVSSGRLHVVPSTEMTINVNVLVGMADPDLSAVTQQRIEESISALIEKGWRSREIGEQININEIYQAVKAVPNVTSIKRILPEAGYYRDGRRYLSALDDGGEFPFATVRNGTHTVRIG